MKDYYLENLRETDKFVAKLSKSGLSEFPPLIITCAITGANQGKESNPNLPETPQEQAQQTYDAYNAGASMVHVHRRSADNWAKMSMKTEEFYEVNALIRQKCPDIIINNTCGGGKLRFPDGHIEDSFTCSLDANPEVASIDISNYAVATVYKKRPAPLTGRDEDEPYESAYGLMPSEALATVMKMKKMNIKPEYEAFDIGDLLYLKSLIQMGVAEGPHLVQFVMASMMTPDYLSLAMKCMPSETVMSTLAIGATQWPLLATAMVMGSNVRVGMEDNIYIERGKLAKCNAELVEKIVRIARELGRPIATPAQAREMLGLGAPSTY